METTTHRASRHTNQPSIPTHTPQRRLRGAADASAHRGLLTFPDVARVMKVWPSWKCGH